MPTTAFVRNVYTLFLLCLFAFTFKAEFLSEITNELLINFQFSRFGVAS